MADVSIANLPAFVGTPVGTDLFPMVDVNDTSESPLGTTKRVTFNQATSTNPGPANFGGDGYAISLTNPANTQFTVIRFIPGGVTAMAYIGVDKSQAMATGSTDGDLVIRTQGTQSLRIVTSGGGGAGATVMQFAPGQVTVNSLILFAGVCEIGATLVGFNGVNNDLLLQPNQVLGAVYIRNSASQNLVSFSGPTLNLIDPGSGSTVGRMAWATTAMSFGTVAAIPLQIQTGNTVRWQFQAAGSLVPNATASYDIGTATVRVRTAYVGTLDVSTTINLAGTAFAAQTTGYNIIADQIGGGMLYVGTAGVGISVGPPNYFTPTTPPAFALDVQGANANGFAASIRNTYSTNTPLSSVLTLQFDNAPNSNTNVYLHCVESLGTPVTRCDIYSNGGIANFQANNVNLSDAALKEVGPVLDGAAWYDRFKQFTIKQFKYLDQTHSDWNIGLIAQEVERAAPELVDETEQAIKVVYTTDLYHAHIAVTQELQRRLEALEAKLVQ